MNTEKRFFHKGRHLCHKEMCLYTGYILYGPSLLKITFACAGKILYNYFGENYIIFISNNSNSTIRN